MLGSLRPLVAALALAPALLVATSTSAAAEGRPPCTNAPRHVSCTILRPDPTGATRPDTFGAPECIVLVGGLGSKLEEIDPFFAPVLGHLVAAGDGRPYRIVDFGVKNAAAHPFAPYGAISLNASHLRGLVRELSAECSAIDVVAHSMGGAVADRAFSMGLSVDDGVVTYLPLSSPHNGSFAARALRVGVDLDDTYASVVSALAQRTGLHDPTSDAVRDLARPPRAPRPPRGVATVRQRLVNDLFVLRRDNIDRRVDVREYLAGLGEIVDGHGGVVRNAHVQVVVEQTIRAHAVPPDERPVLEVKTASLASRAVERYWGGVVAAAGLVLADVAVGSAVEGAVVDAADRIGAGDVDGAAAMVGADAGALVGRAAGQAPRAVELFAAASALRDPLPLTLIKLVLGTVLE